MKFRSASLLLLVVALGLDGCTSFRNKRPDRTLLESSQIIVPATKVSNYLIVETPVEKFGTARFLIDTGSSITLVSPALAARLKIDPVPPNSPQVHVRSAAGGTLAVRDLTLRRLKIGNASFEGVHAIIRDPSDLSDHLGVHIDGIIGFPVFRDTLLTLDYPNSRLIISARTSADGVTGTTVAFNNEENIPIIPIRIGNESLAVLIDSGSDTALSLNPVGLHPVYAQKPRQGGLVGTLTGDRPQYIGRLTDPLIIGTLQVSTPIVELTDELSSLGGEILKNFTISFDQKRNQVTFHRDASDPVPPEPRHSSGISFSRSSAYWRVEGVIPGSPAAGLEIQTGDLCIQINGEPVANWDFARYTQLVRETAEITFTLINGSRERIVKVPVFNLVP
ncbi:MAG TPA: aspartyl protease family protein [Opitutaceae bacterium]|nr:aspartyl protease family protein [Opitutaceae bacterium]